MRKYFVALSEVSHELSAIEVTIVHSTKLEKTSLSAGASDVSYRLGAALLLKYASLEIHKN